MRKLISKILKPYTFSSSLSLYEKIQELEQRITILEEENVETSNTLYQIMNSIDAVDTRIDIITTEKFQ